MVDIHYGKKFLSNILILILFISCANKSDLRIKYPKSKDDRVTVKTALDLAYNAYLNACVTNIDLPKGHRYERCLSMAKRYVKNDVIFILEGGENKK